MAELTSRPGTFAPCSRANVPTNRPGGDFQGRSVAPGGNSLAAGRYRNDGRTGRSPTSFTPTTCGIANARIGAGASARRLAGVGVGQRAVGRSQVDPDDVTGHGQLLGEIRPDVRSAQGISTSAGERTEESSFEAGRAGSCTALARQPWCLRTPWNGGEPFTLPIRRIAAGSKSAATVTAVFLGARSAPARS